MLDFTAEPVECCRFPPVTPATYRDSQLARVAGKSLLMTAVSREHVYRSPASRAGHRVWPFKTFKFLSAIPPVGTPLVRMHIRI